MSQEFIDDLKNRAAALNRRDLGTACQGLPSDFEWHTAADLPDAEVLHGTDALRRYWERLLDEFEDYGTEPVEFIEADGETVIARFVTTAKGRGTGIEMRAEITQVWQLRDGIPWRITEYFDHTSALEAVGLSE
jgi:ketosteroid isomerase-like protein